MNHDNKKKTIISYKKARSLLDTIILMLENDRYCVDVMQQNLAAIGLLKRAQEELMKNHLDTCFTEGVASKSPQKHKKIIAEIKTLMHLGNK